MISVVVADDQALVRGGFRMILEAQDDLRVAGEAEDGSEAVARVRELQPDVVLMDVRMPVLDGSVDHASPEDPRQPRVLEARSPRSRAGRRARDECGLVRPGEH